MGLMKENKEFSRSSVLIGKLFSRSRINNKGDDISEKKKRETAAVLVGLVDIC